MGGISLNEVGRDFDHTLIFVFGIFFSFFVAGFVDVETPTLFRKTPGVSICF